MPSDPIAEVQALVGCPHEGVWLLNRMPRSVASDPDEVYCSKCGMSVKVPTPRAPNCSTLKGAGLTARKLKAFEPRDSEEFQEIILRYFRGEMTDADELDSARAVCELILQALEEK